MGNTRHKFLALHHSSIHDFTQLWGSVIFGLQFGLQLGFPNRFTKTRCPYLPLPAPAFALAWALVEEWPMWSFPLPIPILIHHQIYYRIQ